MAFCTRGSSKEKITHGFSGGWETLKNYHGFHMREWSWIDRSPHCVHKGMGTWDFEEKCSKLGHGKGIYTLCGVMNNELTK